MPETTPLCGLLINGFRGFLSLPFFSFWQGSPCLGLVSHVLSSGSAPHAAGAHSKHGCGFVSRCCPLAPQEIPLQEAFLTFLCLLCLVVLVFSRAENGPTLRISIHLAVLSEKTISSLSWSLVASIWRISLLPQSLCQAMLPLLPWWNFTAQPQVCSQTQGTH